MGGERRVHTPPRVGRGIGVKGWRLRVAQARVCVRAEDRAGGAGDARARLARRRFQKRRRRARADARRAGARRAKPEHSRRRGSCRAERQGADALGA